MPNSSIFPKTIPDPLQRLHVYDGLTMNARRWSIAHDYHRRRQNIHYQALSQPGIVHGLGIELIDPPDTAPARFRQFGRWISIQPGIAIDREGNPIIVDAHVDRSYRIAIDLSKTETVTLYVVVSFVEPDLAYEQLGETIPERFRFDQKTEPPSPSEIELCRIELQTNENGEIVIRQPEDVFFPQVNELDLRYRQSVQVSPGYCVSVGVISDINSPLVRNFNALDRALPGLYPAMQIQVEPISFYAAQTLTNWQWNLLYLPLDYLSNFNAVQLQAFIKQGGTILVETPTLSSVLNPMNEIVQHAPFYAWERLVAESHAIVTEPFTFNLPVILRETNIQLCWSPGLISIEGSLLAAWGSQSGYLRDEIRAAQELGINILQFAWKRHQLTQLSQDLTERAELEA